MTFRQDINGLRAIAVIAVVLFHFKIIGFTGGFVGVDIFFVISGFLMTGIIFNQLREQRFSVLNFYAARARRIIPALIALIIIISILGFLYLQTNDYRALLRNSEYSLLFASNIHYYTHSGYFDLSAQENWLLHTWSLSVEWQFYILYPLIIYSLYKFLPEKIIRILLCVLACISLIATIYYSHYNPTLGFYLLPTRAWELIAGGLVFLYPLNLVSNKVRWFVNALGLLVIILSIFYFNASYPWPSYFTLAPIIGTLLVLYANSTSIITCNPVSQYIGKISYSVYLWHWPIAVLLYFMALSHNLLAISIGIALALILGSLSYYLVEQRFLKKKTAKKTLIQYGVLILFLSTIIMPSIASLVHKFPKQSNFKRYSTEATQYAKCKNHGCLLGSGPISAILIGDSHAFSLQKALLNSNPHSTLIWYSGGCPTLNEFSFSNQKDTKYCQQFFSKITQQLASSYKNIPLIVINRYNLYINPVNEGNHHITFKNTANNVNADYLKEYKKVFVNTFCQLAKDRPVYLVKPIPEMDTNIPRSLAMQQYLFTKPNDITTPFKKYKQTQQATLEAMMQANQQCGIHLLDPTPYFCPDKYNCMGSKDGQPIYRDNNHINDYGNELITPMFEQIFKSKS